MKLHRFYVTEVDLTHDFWVHDQRLLRQWNKVLRLSVNNEIVLFNDSVDRLYKIVALKLDEAHVTLVTEFTRTLPKKEVFLLWSLLKKDKNDWVLQKATELGVRHFVPLLSERTEKTGFDVERAQKIIIEAAEQCGRSDIPTVREPLQLASALEAYKAKTQLYICEQTSDDQFDQTLESVGVLIGPEGGWSDAEKGLFKSHALPHIALHDFTLRAETACLAAVTKLIQ